MCIFLLFINFEIIFYSYLFEDVQCVTVRLCTTAATGVGTSVLVKSREFPAENSERTHIPLPPPASHEMVSLRSIKRDVVGRCLPSCRRAYFYRGLLASSCIVTAVCGDSIFHQRILGLHDQAPPVMHTNLPQANLMADEEAATAQAKAEETTRLKPEAEAAAPKAVFLDLLRQQLRWTPDDETYLSTLEPFNDDYMYFTSAKPL